MRKPTFCICQSKDADQLRGNCEADQRLYFRFLDSMIPLLSKSEISSLWPSSVAVQPGLCRTRSETRMLVFSRLGSYVPLLFTYGIGPFLHDELIKYLLIEIRCDVSDQVLYKLASNAKGG